MKASFQRFDYDYDGEELAEIGDAVKNVAVRVDITHVLFNDN